MTAARAKRSPTGKVLGLASIKDVDGNVSQEALSHLWENFRQGALDLAISEINKKTDLSI